MARARARILIVEDVLPLRSLLRLYLECEGYAVAEARGGAEALAAFEAAEPDLVILDLMLPELSGEVVLRELRRRSPVPILIASAKGTHADRIAGLRGGADDYLPKPFNPHELIARVEAILRRASPRREAHPILVSLGGGRVVFDRVNRRYVRNTGGEGRLTPGEARLLIALARDQGATLTRAQLLRTACRERRHDRGRDDGIGRYHVPDHAPTRSLRVRDSDPAAAAVRASATRISECTNSGTRS